MLERAEPSDVGTVDLEVYPIWPDSGGIVKSFLKLCFVIDMYCQRFLFDTYGNDAEQGTAA
jgi:hypothetical protein